MRKVILSLPNRNFLFRSIDFWQWPKSGGSIQYVTNDLKITTNNASQLILLIPFFYSFRLLEMRMPRSSSFSVRDILDLPQMKNNSSNATSDTSPTHTTDISSHHQRFHGKLIKNLILIVIHFIYR